MRSFVVLLAVSMLLVTCSLVNAAGPPSAGSVDLMAVYQPGTTGGLTWDILVGQGKYDVPVWDFNGQNLFVDNVETPNAMKRIWLWAIYDAQNWRDGALNDALAYPLGGVGIIQKETWEDPIGLTKGWYWEFPTQPASEQLVLENSTFLAFSQLSGPSAVYVATQCNAVPEPSSLVAIGTGAMGLLGFVFRKRKH